MTNTRSLHVSEVIREELEARGWTLDILAVQMSKEDIAVNRLTLDLMMACDTEPDAWLGYETAKQLGVAFGTSPWLFLNLDRAWHAAMGKTAVPAFCLPTAQRQEGDYP